MHDACVDSSSESSVMALKLEGKADGSDQFVLETMSGIGSQEVERLGSRSQVKD